MIYGLYLSASGVLANSHRQDVIANNLANAQTTGFKRHLSLFRQRNTATQEKGLPVRGNSNDVEEHIGGGMFITRSAIDYGQGDIESTGNPLDVAIKGDGFFAVQAGGKTLLTRNGSFTLDSTGQLVTGTGGAPILSNEGKPIKLTPGFAHSIRDDGVVMEESQAIGKIGLFNVDDTAKLAPQGGNLLAYPGLADVTKLPQGTGTLAVGSLEESNVEPASEMTQLMDTQRALEANANMIRFQDQSLSRLVNDVAKIS